MAFDVDFEAWLKDRKTFGKAALAMIDAVGLYDLLGDSLPRTIGAFKDLRDRLADAAECQRFDAIGTVSVTPQTALAVIFPTEPSPDIVAELEESGLGRLPTSTAEIWVGKARLTTVNRIAAPAGARIVEISLKAPPAPSRRIRREKAQQGTRANVDNESERSAKRTKGAPSTPPEAAASTSTRSESDAHVGAPDTSSADGSPTKTVDKDSEVASSSEAKAYATDKTSTNPSQATNATYEPDAVIATVTSADLTHDDSLAAADSDTVTHNSSTAPSQVAEASNQHTTSTTLRTPIAVVFLTVPTPDIVTRLVESGVSRLPTSTAEIWVGRANPTTINQIAAPVGGSVVQFSLNAPPAHNRRAKRQRAESSTQDNMNNELELSTDCANAAASAPPPSVASTFTQSASNADEGATRLMDRPVTKTEDDDLEAPLSSEVKGQADTATEPLTVSLTSDKVLEWPSSARTKLSAAPLAESDPAAPEEDAAAYDAIGGPHFNRSFACLAPGGLLIGYGSQTMAIGRESVVEAGLGLLRLRIWGALSFLFRGRRALWYSITDRRRSRPDEFRADMAALFELLRNGAIHPVVIGREPLAAARNVHTRIDAGGLGGKIVLIPWLVSAGNA